MCKIREEARQELLSCRLLASGEMFQDLGGVAFGGDGGPDGFDFAGLADEE